MSLSLTIFENVYDNKTHRSSEFTTWEDLESLLYNLSTEKCYYKAKKGTPRPSGMKPAPLISPAAYIEGSTRANDTVTEWSGWCAVDVDEAIFLNVEKEVTERFGKWTFCCYSTASSKKEHPKFRLVFPLTGNPRNKEIKHFWFALNMELGEISDPQTKDLSRMYYIPAQYPNAYNFIFSNVGETMNPWNIMSKHEYVEKKTGTMLDKLPPAMKAAILADRAGKLTNTSYSWSYYDNCPFLPKSTIDEYMSISGTGWYHQSYRIMLAIAANAVRKKYPISVHEVATLCRQMDCANSVTRERYKGRNYEKEAERAIEYVMSRL